SRVGLLLQAECPGEVLALEAKVPGVVKVTQGAILEVQVVEHDRRLGMLAPVVRAGGVRQPPCVSFRRDELAGGKMLERMLDQRTPDVKLLYVDAVEITQLAVGRLEKSPLIALEVDGGHERKDGSWLE